MLILNSQNSNENDFSISDYCPQFLWVLRDFALDLKGKAP